MDYRRWNNFFYGRTLQDSKEMTLGEVNDTLEDTEPVGAVLSSCSGRERLEPAEAIQRLKDSVNEASDIRYERYDGKLDSLHYVDAKVSGKECGDVSLKLREIKF